jgi:hypothetical protein
MDMGGVAALSTYFVGCDLGTEDQDFTAISVVEGGDFNDEGKPLFKLRWLDRWRSLTSPESIQKIAQMVLRPPLLGNAELVVDARGLGWPICDELERLGHGVRRVMTTSGTEENTKVSERGTRSYNTPKDRLVAAAVVPYQDGRLLISPRLPYRDVLEAEIEVFGRKFSRKPGYEKFEAASGEHDDVVMSVCFGCWGAGRLGSGVVDESLAFTYDDLVGSEGFDDRWDTDFSRWQLGRR